ncbi:MAG: TonB family protein [Candidatus Dadabacteria bacterium]|nr:TonB family protein [Candidatus Dadabacteria bacterium]MYC39475.1 TonB family protein [Candidatus Dadabacteria bacterium]
MKGEENLFRKGLFISLGLHLLIVCLLVLGVGGHGEISPESSIEVSLSTHTPRIDKKKSEAKAPSRPKKPEKSVKKKAKKAPPAQVKTPEKKKEPPAAPVVKKQEPPKVSQTETKNPEKKKEPAVKPKETATGKTAEKTEPETRKETPTAEESSLESEREEVIRNIKKESVLKTIKKTAGTSGQPASKEAGPGLISLVLDVYYRTISKRIQKNLFLLPNIDSSVFLAAQVNFYMKETGEVYDVGIERSSGNAKFDSYCIKAVNAASPLPAPPTELRDRIKSEFFIISCETKK